jgi:hypothetical protein
MVCVHYIVVEKIKYEDRVQNEIDLVTFLIGWHIVFMIFKNAEESRRKINEDFKIAIVILIATFAIISIVVCLATPFLAWFSFEAVFIQTNYWALLHYLQCNHQCVPTSQ